jgi:hypothetical protein
MALRIFSVKVPPKADWFSCEILYADMGFDDDNQDHERSGGKKRKIHPSKRSGQHGREKARGEGKGLREQSVTASLRF